MIQVLSSLRLVASISMADRTPLHAAVVMLLVSSVACLGPGDIPQTGVQGSVTNAATRAPIGGATVAAAGRQVVTGPEGRFILLDIGEGRITVRVTHPDYVDAQREVVSVARREYPVLDVALTPKP